MCAIIKTSARGGDIMHKERMKEHFKGKNLGYLIVALLIVLTLFALCGVAFYFLGVLLPIQLWQTGHPVLAVAQFYIAFTSLIYGGSKS